MALAGKCRASVHVCPLSWSGCKSLPVVHGCVLVILAPLLSDVDSPQLHWSMRDVWDQVKLTV